MTRPADFWRHSRPVLRATAVGFALLEAVSVQARTRAIDGLRISETSLPRADADAYQTGRSLLAAGDVTGAMTAFRQALVDAPQSIDALNGVGACYDRMGRYDLSRSYYDAALAIDPGAAITLNNLGYSLFLAADYSAAIPLLLRAAASDDAAVNANARQLLVQTAEKLRLARPAAGTATMVAGLAPPAVVQIAAANPQQPKLLSAARAHGRRDPPSMQAAEAPVQLRVATGQAHIEQSSSGEQRLVLGEPTPDAVLTASLGDDAVLVLVAPAWTARDDRRMAFDEAARLRLGARAAAADLADLFPLGPDRLAENSLAESATTRLIAARFPVAAETRRPAAVAALQIDGDSQQTFARLADNARRLRENAFGAAQSVARSDATGGATDDETPPVGWLLAGRSASGPASKARIVAQGPQIDSNAPAFDSDDGNLNAFAARMRGLEPAPVSNGEAVARLEALVARLQGA